jgi:hypothetical protein
MDGPDRELFAHGVRRAVSTQGAGELDASLLDLGWHDALASDTAEAVAILFEALGAQHARSSALGSVLARALDLEHAGAIGAVLPAFGRWDPPGRRTGETLTIDGLSTGSLSGADQSWVVVENGTGQWAVAVPRAALTLQPVHGIDPDLGLTKVTGTVAWAAVDPVALLRPWPDAVAVAQLAVGHELVGAARAMLELARQHALDRVQFGQAISGFQAVRHRLAEALVAIESADAVLAAAWEDGTPTTAAVAKALAGRGARTTVAHCQQVLAGIGFTTEHDFHHFARRAFLLDHLFGSTSSLTRSFGAAVLSEGRLPPFAPL